MNYSIIGLNDPRNIAIMKPKLKA